ncbi:MAG: enoyl-CoA hydratase-related protein [Oleiphilaceae bacterium]|uniref:enoyl-CoA hydratase/isomerase family protein n=2 Tax=Oleiphilus sp. HI0125 TaxID=1822266 RepID=UPI0007C25151|nr:enoyl-CoA hydratase-related protein [Oleiphilus sp. HI0125]KZZ59738.1 enoyl-CoA hydratase [Oleiphilus sp. HI0125]MCH2157657.1 enoyl-CoA hydratase-related protein [Oleiphilaceae bacterium]
MTTLPQCETLLIDLQDHVLQITLNRPKTRNAMSLQMVQELMSVFKAIEHEQNIRVVVMRGAEGHFCAGGDIKDMANARAALGQKAEGDEDPFYALNREFGRMITFVNQIPQVLIVVAEGAVLGGGFGLVCISDLALCLDSTQFGLPETSLGIPPAQIAPFVVTRIGLTQARRLSLFGARFKGTEAKELGIVHECLDSNEALETALETALSQVKNCAPQANRTTKELILSVGHQPLESLLDGAAKNFASAVQGAEGQEGTMAFIQKRKASWAE